LKRKVGKFFFFYHGVTAPGGPRPPHCRGFAITLRHTAVGRTPMDARRRDLYLTTYNTQQETDTHAPPTGFETTIPISERPQTYALDRAATGIGKQVLTKYNSILRPCN